MSARDVDSEYGQRASRWFQSSDEERIALLKFFEGAWHVRDSEPERVLSVMAQCSETARKLREPWWVVYFDSRRLNMLTAQLEEFARARPLAMELMVQINSSGGQFEIFRPEVVNGFLYTHVSIDPAGYREELEQAFAHQEKLLPKNWSRDRLIFQYRRANFLRDLKRPKEAYDLMQESLLLIDQSGSRDVQVWDGCWAGFLMCRLCNDLGRYDELAGHSDHVAELAASNSGLRQTEADAWLWRAGLQRRQGQDKASRSFHKGMRLLKNVDCRDTVCTEPISIYHELAGELNAVVEVRTREAAEAGRQGKLHDVCHAHIERCRVLGQLGELTTADLEAAREAAQQLKFPQPHLEKVEIYAARLNGADERSTTDFE